LWVAQHTVVSPLHTLFGWLNIDVYRFKFFKARTMQVSYLGVVVENPHMFQASHFEPFNFLKRSSETPSPSRLAAMLKET